MQPIRSGNWNNSANAGVFALNCNNPRSNANTNIGSQPDSDSPHILKRNSGAKGDFFLQLARAFAKFTEYPLSSSYVERLRDIQ